MQWPGEVGRGAVGRQRQGAKSRRLARQSKRGRPADLQSGSVAAWHSDSKEGRQRGRATARQSDSEIARQSDSKAERQCSTGAR